MHICVCHTHRGGREREGVYNKVEVELGPRDVLERMRRGRNYESSDDILKSINVKKDCTF